jgi:hypothetical protein
MAELKKTNDNLTNDIKKMLMNCIPIKIQLMVIIKVLPDWMNNIDLEAESLKQRFKQ